MTTYRITGTDHDLGARDVTITRQTEIEAEWTADLHRQCGYRTVTIVAVEVE